MGPFPAVLFNHGSGHTPGSAASRADRRRPELLGPLFQRHGYAFLYLYRRGDGLSGGQGAPAGDLMDREFARKGQAGKNRLQIRLLEKDESQDATAGLALLRAHPRLDPRRTAVVGVSFGSSLSLIVASHDTALRAVVAFATAGYSWEKSKPLQARLLAAVSQITAPVLFIHAANDYSIEPGNALAAEMSRLHRAGTVRIFPPAGITREDGHNFIHIGIPAWENEVFSFLDARVKATGR